MQCDGKGSFFVCKNGGIKKETDQWRTCVYRMLEPGVQPEKTSCTKKPGSGKYLVLPGCYEKKCTNPLPKSEDPAYYNVYGDEGAPLGSTECPIEKKYFKTVAIDWYAWSTHKDRTCIPALGWRITEDDKGATLAEVKKECFDLGPKNCIGIAFVCQQPLYCISMDAVNRDGKSGGWILASNVGQHFFDQTKACPMWSMSPNWAIGKPEVALARWKKLHEAGYKPR